MIAIKNKVAIRKMEQAGARLVEKLKGIWGINMLVAYQ